jgi:PII-like signaling protein
MEKNQKATLLRIFISSTDKADSGKVLYESVVFKAKEAGLAGATVLKGMLGYGASSVIHSYKFWEVTEKIPVIVEIIDDEEKVLSFFEKIRPDLEAMHYGCLVTTERMNVLLYKSGKRKLFQL